MVDRGLLVVSSLVVNDTKVNMSKELSCNICHFLMSRVVINRIAIELMFLFSQLHVVDTDAVVGEGLSVNVADGLAHLQELLVRLDSHLVLSEVVI